MPDVRWPARYHPARGGVFVSNRVAILASPPVIWAWLIRATRWPEWYPNSAAVRLPEGAGSDLTAGMRFRWRTFGIGLVSEVKEFEPCTRIAWDGQAIGLDVYHAWVIEQTGPGESLVLTEESQYGLLARLSNLFMSKRMSDGHQLWLEGLKEKAESGLP